jgi:predicted Fe-Mo cluster-binding NifX family protein
MRIAFAANGNSLESRLADCFAKCSYFMIYNTVSTDINFVKNPMRFIVINAGQYAIKILQNQRVNLVVSRNFGMKALKAARKKNMQTHLFEDDSKNMYELIKLFNNTKILNNESCNFHERWTGE